MFIKKGKIIFFVIILSLFAFIALATNICRAETWEITIDDTYDPIARDFTYISRNFDISYPGTRRINIVGHDCAQGLVTGDVFIIPTRYNNEPLTPYAAEINDATFTGGTVTANFILPLAPYFDSLPYFYGANYLSVKTIKVWILGSTSETFLTDHAYPFEVDGFYPDPVSTGMKVYNFFNAYLDANHDEYSSPGEIDDPVLLSFVGIDNPVQNDSNSYEDVAKMYLDFAAYLDQNLIQEGSDNISDTPPYHAYDYQLVYTDRAGNQVPASKNNIRAYKYIDPNADTFKNAYTAFDYNPLAVDDDTSVEYKIIFPNNMLTGPTTQGKVDDDDATNYIVNGYRLVHSGTITPDGTLDVLTIHPDDLADAHLGYTPETWTQIENRITVAHHVTSHDYAFGVDDGVGPRLMASFVDPNGGKTYFKFSEPLKDTGALDVLDIMTQSCADSTYGECFCLENLTFDPADEKGLILDKALANGEIVWVSDNNAANEDIMDEQGNLAQQNKVTTVTIRRLLSIKVVGVDKAADETTVEITFNDTMDDDAATKIEEALSYYVTLRPGLEYYSWDTSRAVVKSATLGGPDDTVVTLKLDGVIERTDKANLPQVAIDADNVGDLLGDTGGALFPPYTLESIDEVGPYIFKATFDENGYYTGNWQGQKTPRTFNKLTMTFSEEVFMGDIEDCLSTFCWPFKFKTGYPSPLGTGAQVDVDAVDKAIIYIRLGDNSLPPFPMAPHVNPHNTIQVKSDDSLWDVDPNTGDPVNNASINEEVPILDETRPYIVRVETVDGDANGKLEALEVEFDANVDITNDWPFADVPLTATVGGVPIELREANGTWNKGTLSGNILTIELDETLFTDTGAMPELIIQFDSNNTLVDTTNSTHANPPLSTPDPPIWNQNINSVEDTVTVPGGIGGRVIDGANPQFMKAEYQLVQVIDESLPGETWEYMMTMTFSELIDPNVWLDPNDRFRKVAPGPDGIFHITDFGSADIDPNDCVFDPYEMTRVPRKTLMFSLFSDRDISTDPPNFELVSSDTKVWDINQGLTADIVGSPGLESTELYIPPSAVATAPYYDPKFKTNCAMMVYGTVTGLNDVNDKPGDWVIAAYTEDDLFHYRPDGGSWPEYHTGPPVDAATDAEARMAVGGTPCTCLGSTNVQLGSTNTTGTYCLIVYGQDGQTEHDSAFEDGANKPVFLVLINTQGDNDEPNYIYDCGNDQAYLVSGGVQADGDFYLGFDDSYDPADPTAGPKEYNIDLSRQERITLYNGWNFVSTSVKKNHHLAGALVEPQALRDAATDLEITIPKVEMTSINCVFSSIPYQWLFVSSHYVDADGRESIWDINEDITPDEPMANLPFFTVGYGFWIYIPVVEQTTLTVFGDVITAEENDDTPYYMPLYDGWNLVGNWGGHAKFADASPEDVWFSTALEDKVIVPTVENVFGLPTLGPLEQARSFRARPDAEGDVEGILSWYADAPLGLELNLDYAGPGTGTCLKMDGPDVLMWDALP